MITLLATISLPYLRSNGARMALTLLGVIIGVQGMVAMASLNRSIVRAFERGVDVIAGDAVLQIAGPESGIPESLASIAQDVQGVQHVSALVQGSFQPARDPNVRIAVFGVDFLEQVAHRNPQFPREHVHIRHEISFLNALDSIALGTPLIERLGLELGATLDLITPAGLQTFTLRGTVDPVGPVKLHNGAVALLDLPNAQRLLLKPGLVQAIYVTLADGVNEETVKAELQKALDGRARVESTSIRGQQFGALLGSLRVALSLASIVTMIVAFFIIYQTMAISVDQRRRDIAIARALGFTRSSIVFVFLAEGAIMGSLGAAGGVIGGYLLARLSLSTAMAGVTEMYVAHVAGAELSPPLGETAVAVTLGIATCVLASCLPAFRSAGQPPAQVLRSTSGTTEPSATPASLALGTAVVLAAIGVLSSDLRLPTSGAKTAWIMLGHGLLLTGSSLFAPAFVTLIATVTRSLKGRATLIVDLAADFFARQPRRTAATASAIMVGYALVVVLGSVVYSITGNLRGWLDKTFDSDLIVGTSPGLAATTFQSELATKLEQIPDVRSVERYRKALLVFENSPIVIVAFDRKNRPDKTPLVVTKSAPHAYEAAERGNALFISESFAFRFSVDIGDQISLPTATGPRLFDVRAVVRDYTFDLGTVFVDIDVYQELWQDTRLTYAKIWTDPEASIPAVRSAVAIAIAAEPQVNMITNVEFREEVEGRVYGLLRVLDSLQVFASLIAVLSVANLLLASVLDRRREIGLLRSVGVTRGQVRRAVVVEAGLMGLTGALLGVVAGGTASFFMVTHSLRIDMGWSLDFYFPFALALSTMVATTAAAAVAGYLPARRITAGTVLEGVQTE